MSSLTILLIRHAEKPDSGFPGPGLSDEGKKDDKSLLIRGWQRAGAWAALLGADLSPDYPRANAVYAAAPEPVEKGADYSHRPYETSLPLAGRLGVDVIARWGVGQEKDLVDEITKLTGVIVVFWEHKSIAASLIPSLLGNQHVPGVPKKWDGDRFDVVLRFDRMLPDAPWAFRQLSPRLLGGDSDAPFKKTT